MPYLFFYLLKFSIAIGCFYIFYLLVLRRLTFYQWNRFYLSLYPLVCFFIPFIDVSDVLKEDTLLQTPLVGIPTLSGMSSVDVISNVNNTDSFYPGVWDIILMVFIIGVLFMIGRLLKQYYAIWKIRNAATVTKQNQIWLFDVDEKINPFSFGNHIYVNRRMHSEEELDKIIQHEFIHVKQRHTLDLMIGELICIINWFNPFAWLMRTAIRQNLEFIADNGVLASGADARQYQYLLLKVIGVPQYAITNHFSYSSLKKRIAMMNKLRSAKVHLAKFLFLFPVCALMLVAFRNNQLHQEAAQNAQLLQQAVPDQDTTPPAPPNPPAVKQPSRVSVATPPVPPVPPAPAHLPQGVKSVYVDEARAIVTYKSSAVVKNKIIDTVIYHDKTVIVNSGKVSTVYKVRDSFMYKEKDTARYKSGKTMLYESERSETYDLKNPQQKEAFEKKFGEFVEPSIPPVAPVPAIPPTMKQSNNFGELYPGEYILKKEALDRFLAGARAKGEIFVGIVNPFDLKIDHIRKEDIEISWSGGNTRVVNGLFYLLPTKTGTSKLIIFKKEADGSKTLLKTLDLNSKRLPDPSQKSTETLKKENGTRPIHSSLLWPPGSPWTPSRDRC